MLYSKLCALLKPLVILTVCCNNFTDFALVWFDEEDCPAVVPSVRVKPMSGEAQPVVGAPCSVLWHNRKYFTATLKLLGT